MSATVIVTGASQCNVNCDLSSNQMSLSPTHGQRLSIVSTEEDSSGSTPKAVDGHSHHSDSLDRDRLHVSRLDENSSIRSQSICSEIIRIEEKCAEEEAEVERKSQERNHSSSRNDKVDIEADKSGLISNMADESAFGRIAAQLQVRDYPHCPEHRTFDVT